jgi:alkyl hydroperoxide reductase subunit AhpC
VLKEDEGISYRGLFLIDTNGIIRHITINDLPIGRSVEEVLRVLQAVQHADTHSGEGCPASWKPGSKTIFTDPEGSKKFFKETYGHKDL